MINLSATEHHKQRELKLLDYINRYREEIIESTGSDKLIYLAKDYWIYLKMKVWNTSKQILEVPDCCPVAKSIRFGWDKNEHYLECEILNDGTKEFFYRNRITKEAIGEDYFPRADISENILEKLQLFVE